MTTMIEFTEGHYEVQKTSYGEAYVWCPECVVVGCDCGESVALTASKTVCSCGADHAALVREVLASRQASESTVHPWDAAFDEWRKQQEEYLDSEETYRLELSRLD